MVKRRNIPEAPEVTRARRDKRHQHQQTQNSKPLVILDQRLNHLTNKFYSREVEKLYHESMAPQRINAFRINAIFGCVALIGLTIFSIFEHWEDQWDFEWTLIFGIQMFSAGMPLIMFFFSFAFREISLNNIRLLACISSLVNDLGMIIDDLVRGSLNPVVFLPIIGIQVCFFKPPFFVDGLLWALVPTGLIIALIVRTVNFSPLFLEWQRGWMLISTVFGGTLGLLVYLHLGDHFSRVVFLRSYETTEQMASLNEHKKHAESLLLQLLPMSIVDRYKKTGSVSYAEHIENVTVLFVDLKGFNELIMNTTHEELPQVILILNSIFYGFDEASEKYSSVEKIKTIGTKYMAASGLFPQNILLNKDNTTTNENANEDSEDTDSYAGEAAVQLMLLVLECMAIAQSTMKIIQNAFSEHSIGLQLGMNTGDMVAGIVGKEKYLFDIFGDTVNVASRMQSTCPVNSIQISKTTYNFLKSSYEFVERHNVFIKGKGLQTTYTYTPTLESIELLMSTENRGTNIGILNDDEKFSSFSNDDFEKIITSITSKHSHVSSVSQSDVTDSLSCVDEDSVHVEVSTCVKERKSSTIDQGTRDLMNTLTGVHFPPMAGNAHMSYHSIDDAILEDFQYPENETDNASFRIINKDSIQFQTDSFVCSDNVSVASKERRHSRVLMSNNPVLRTSGAMLSNGPVERLSRHKSDSSLLSHKVRSTIARVINNKISPETFNEDDIEEQFQPIKVIKWKACFNDIHMESLYQDFFTRERTTFGFLAACCCFLCVVLCGFGSAMFFNIWGIRRSIDQIPAWIDFKDQCFYWFFGVIPVNVIILVSFRVNLYFNCIARFGKMQISRWTLRNKLINTGISYCSTVVLFVSITVVSYADVDARIAGLPDVGMSISLVYLLLCSFYTCSEVILFGSIFIIVGIPLSGINRAENLFAAILWFLAAPFVVTSVHVERRLIFLMKQEMRKRAQLITDTEEQVSSLLLDVLPVEIVQRLKEHPDKAVVLHFDSVSIMALDIVGFTNISSSLTAPEVVNMLDVLFSEIDTVCQLQGVEKLYTVGDAYILAAGVLPDQVVINHTHRVCAVALDIIFIFEMFNCSSFKTGNLENIDVRARIGVHTGPAVGALMGGKVKFKYDILGSTMTVAEIMEQTGEPSKVQVSEDVFEVLRENTVYHFEKLPQMVDVKILGTERAVRTYFITP